MNIDIVIVTYNRLEKLKKALRCYEQQTIAFRNLILVDNCSTDGTKEFIDEWQQQPAPFQKVVIHASENKGGSGGFYMGERKALELGADWVFIADDDAYSKPSMMADFKEFIETHNCSNIVAVCTTVRKVDGNIDLCHRDRFKIERGENWLCKKFVRYSAPLDEYQKDFFDIDVLSYVGSFINGGAMKKCGLVNPQYFIYWDDTEHSLRLRKYGRIVVVPKLEMLHEGGSSGDKVSSLSWRSYYDMRNKTHMLLKHFPRTVLYFVYYELRRFIGRKIHNSPANEYDLMCSDAIIDALFSRLGKNRKYSPKA